MTVYTVQDRPVDSGREPDFVLIKEGFNWWAFLVPLIWLLARQQWLGLLVYVAASAVIAVAGTAIGVDVLTQSLVWLVFGLFVGASANDWRRWQLDEAGYRFAGVVEGHGLDDAEERWLRRQPTTASRTTSAAGMAEVAPRPPRRGLEPFASPFDPV